MYCNVKNCGSRKNKCTDVYNCDNIDCPIQGNNIMRQVFKRMEEDTMDAVKFIEERNRMCESFCDGCKGCPAFNEPRCMVSSAKLDAKEQIAIVEKWSAEHPRKTRQDVFLKQCPEADIGGDGVLRICPSLVAASYRLDNGECVPANEHKYTHCSDCRREFWMQEVE